MRAPLVVVLCFAFLPMAAQACRITDELMMQEHKESGCPKDVDKFFGRAFMCDHWGGEEPYDKARLAEIREAVRVSRCDRMQDDYVKLRKTYAEDAQVGKAIEKANRKYDFGFSNGAK